MMLAFFWVASLAAASLNPFSPFEGHWSCQGRFVASGKPIASELDMTIDPSSGVFIVHHDDAASAPYHSLEMWTADPDGRALHAAVADSFSGLRVFRSAPLRNGEIVFDRPEDGSPQEEFHYKLNGAGGLQVDWSVSRSGAPVRLGDTLNCLRKPA